MCEECGWEDQIEFAESLIDFGIDDPSIEDTVRGISRWVTSNEHVTERQVEALESIAEVQASKRERGWE